MTLYSERNAVSSHLLSPDRHLPCDATRGAVGGPARDGLVFRVIRRVEITKALSALCELAAAMFASDPGPIIRVVYRYRAGKLERVPLKPVGGRVVALEGPRAVVTTGQRFS
ncbi:MAG: hypothetical protein JWM10_1213 [Myxococcaceae bacterium]|nr:hypothetical protein [Myxococcaceae bacterium]